MPESSTADIHAEITKYFAPHTPLPDSNSLLAECVKLCQNFNVTPSELFFKWEAMTFDFKSVHSSILRTLDMEAIRALKVTLQKGGLGQGKKTAGQPAMLSGVMSRGAIGVFGAQRRFPDSHPLALSSTNIAMQVKREPDGSGFPGSSKVKFICSESGGSRSQRYMYEKLSERSDVLDDKIDDFAEIVRNHYGLSEFGDPAATTEDDVIVVGRIVSDSETQASASVKLSDGSVALESSRMMGSGARIPLRFDSNLKVRRGENGIGLFRGAIVALKGRNGGGGWFLVTEVLSIPPMTPPAQLVKPDGEASFTMCIASGPYTADSDLLYKPWHDLMTDVAREKPDVVLLNGPFIDSSHPCIKNGEIDYTPTEIFRAHFEQHLNDYLASFPQATILIVPSVQDMLSDNAVFPQPRMNADLMADHRVHFLPNPCKFSLDGVSFAVSTVDVLFHLRKEEFYKRAEQIEPTKTLPEDAGGDAMVSLCRHLLQQRSFYPMFPVPFDNARDVNLDISHSKLLTLDGESGDHSPHVLITPSRLKQFTKSFDGVAAINPSFLSKGTFASLSFRYTGSADVKDNIKAEIRKIGETRAA